MSNKLDREGIFMARAIAWQVRVFESSSAAAINIEFQVLGQLNDQGGWDDWRSYEDHTVFGSFFFAKKDGTLNEVTVEQLVKSGLWDGNLFTVNDGPPPTTAVQISVGAEEYKGQTYYKAKWVNHKDFKPQPPGASEGDVRRLNDRFGSLLRACAASAAASQEQPQVAQAKTAVQDDPNALTPPVPQDPPPSFDEDDLPF